MIHGIRKGVEAQVKDGRLSPKHAGEIFRNLNITHGVVKTTVPTVDVSLLCETTLTVTWLLSNQPSALLHHLVAVDAMPDTSIPLFAIQDDGDELAFMLSHLPLIPELKECPKPIEIVDACVQDIVMCISHGTWCAATAAIAKHVNDAGQLDADVVINSIRDNRGAPDPCIFDYLPPKSIRSFDGNNVIVYPALAAFQFILSMGSTDIAAEGRDAVLSILEPYKRANDRDKELSSFKRDLRAYWIQQYRLNTGKKLWTPS